MLTSHDIRINTGQFTDRGFKKEFREVDNDGNVRDLKSQARHFVGALIAAYRGNVTGAEIGTGVMDGREAFGAATTGDGSMADVRLNHAAARLAGSVGSPAFTGVTQGGEVTRHPPNNAFKTLAPKIRKEVCE
jgi:hypothetical protein